MPYDVTTIALPSGASCLRVVGSGVISKEDADYLMTFIAPGRPHARAPMVVLAQEMTSIAPEARALFSGLGPDGAWCAVVMSNPVVRVTTNFLSRVNRNPKVKLFATEAEALSWLEESAGGKAKPAGP